MSREIKFRFWDGKVKGKGSWHYFELLKSDPDDLWYSYWDKEKTGQFTGLKDKSGKEIYEGDVVAAVWNGHEHYRFEVEWADGGFNISEHSEGKLSERIKVIGNIHQNPELLKK